MIFSLNRNRLWLLLAMLTTVVSSENPFDNGYYVPKDVFKRLDPTAGDFFSSVEAAAVHGVDHDSYANSRRLQQSLVFVPIYRVDTLSPSPAPSMVPSGAPSLSLKPSESPSNFPSVSVMPSTSPTDKPSSSPSSAPTTFPSSSPITPSVVPTSEPSDLPSPLPSSSPTTEAPSAPSSVPSTFPSSSPITPSAVPTSVPSHLPTSPPSSSPTTEASNAPSSAPSASPSIPPIHPSAVPTSVPSHLPTSLPSYSPTTEAFRTKTATIVINLDGVDSAMPGDVVTYFEAELYGFLRVHISGDSIQPKMLLDSAEDPDYIVDIQATKVLSQVYVDGRDPEELEDEGDSVSPHLSVHCEVVGEVIFGVVPSGYDLSDDVYEVLDEFLGDLYRRLARRDDFFQASLQMYDSIGDIESGEEIANKRTQLIITVSCALVAFLIAICASYYAISKHLERKRKHEGRLTKIQRRRKRLSHMSDDVELDLQNTAGCSADEPLSYSEDIDEDDHDDDDESGSNPRSLQLDVDEMKRQVGNALVMPSSILSSMFSQQPKGYARTPTSDPDEGFSDKSDGKDILKQWMAPRRSSNDISLASSHVDDTVVNESQDPPDIEVALSNDSSTRRGGQSMDKRQRIECNSPKVIDGHVFGDELKLFRDPDDVFSIKNNPHENYVICTKDSEVTPLGSAVNSTASNFFMKVGSVFGKSTPKGRAPTKKTDPDGNLKTLQPQYWSGSEAGASDFPDSDAGYNAEHLMYDGSERQDGYNLEKYRTQVTTHVIKSHQMGDNWEEDSMKDVDLEDEQFQPPMLGASAPPSYHGNDGDQPPNSPEHGAPGGNLGARSLTDTEMNQYKEKRSIDTNAKRAGLYDVFAPNGPIGIVVDTTDEGPSVHSVKSTSPMLGLISPGDLIVALDNEDTRNMSAAALTRLMAHKSRQKERKITLISMDGY